MTVNSFVNLINHIIFNEVVIEPDFHSRSSRSSKSATRLLFTGGLLILEGATLIWDGAALDTEACIILGSGALLLFI